MKRKQCHFTYRVDAESFNLSPKVDMETLNDEVGHQQVAKPLFQLQQCKHRLLVFLWKKKEVWHLLVNLVLHASCPNNMYSMNIWATIIHQFTNSLALMESSTVLWVLLIPRHFTTLLRSLSLAMTWKWKLRFARQEVGLLQHLCCRSWLSFASMVKSNVRIGWLAAGSNYRLKPAKTYMINNQEASDLRPRCITVALSASLCSKWSYWYANQNHVIRLREIRAVW